MNRIGFLRQLEELLRDIPDNERREAMEYYRNYFDDVGPENEQKIIEELGSPAKVAESIKKDLFKDAYQSGDFVKPDPAPQPDKTSRNVIIAVLLVITFPFWFAVLATAFGLMMGLIGVLIGFSVCIIALVGVFFVAGVVLAVTGMFKVFTGFPAVGLVVCGVGMLFLAFGTLGLLAMVWAVGKVLPWAVRGIVSLCRRIFQRKGAAI